MSFSVRFWSVACLFIACVRCIPSEADRNKCCETTTRLASDSGYHVDYVTDATLTFPMTDRLGKQWSPAEIKARTELVLDNRFARMSMSKTPWPEAWKNLL